MDVCFEILLHFGEDTFFKAILKTFLCFRMAIRNFTYCCQYFDKDLDCWPDVLKN